MSAEAARIRTEELWSEMIEKILGLIGALQKKEYAKASLYYVAANIIGQGVVLLSSAVFTRMMSKSDFGLVSTYSTWVLVLNTFICLNLFVTVRNAYIDFPDDYDRYNSSVLLLSLLSGVVLTVLIAAGVSLVHGSFSLEVVLLACIQSVALNVVNYMMAIQSMKNQYRQRAFLMIAPNWVHILLSIVLMLVFTQNLFMAKISGNAFGILIFGVFCCLVLFRKAVPEICPSYWKYALIIAVPSIFNTLSDLILMQCDRLMLTSMVGAEETAEYSIIYNVGSIIVAIYQAANGAWTPWFYNRAANREYAEARKYQGHYLLLFTAFTCGMITISPELIRFMSPVNYWGGIRCVAPIIVASYLIFLYAFLTAFLMFEKKTGKIARNTVIAAAANLLLNYYLIPAYRSAGAVAATVLSYVLLFCLHYFSVDREGKDYFSLRAMLLNLAFVSAYGAVLYTLRDLWLLRYLLFIVAMIFLYVIKGRTVLKEFLGSGS